MYSMTNALLGIYHTYRVFSYFQEVTTELSLLSQTKKGQNMGLVDVVYRGVFRRSSTFAVAILGGAIVFETYFNEICDKWLAQHNAGVSI